MKNIKIEKRLKNKPTDGYFVKINYMHGDADIYNSTELCFNNIDDIIEHYFCSSFDYERHNWNGLNINNIVYTLIEFGFETLNEALEKYDILSCYDYDKIKDYILIPVEELLNCESMIQDYIVDMFNDFIGRDDFEIIIPDNACDGYHAAEVTSIEYYEIKDGITYVIDLEIED